MSVLTSNRTEACLMACIGIPTAALEAGTLAEFMVHVQAMLTLIRSGTYPREMMNVAEDMLRELGRTP